MRKNIIISVGIFLSLAASRFIPHPPNFTSLIALSFYVPVLLGLRFIPFLIISFAITDFIIGYHSGTHWTWGSVLLIGLLSFCFVKNTATRLIGAIISAVIFFLVTNFGVWTTGMYGYSAQGLYTSYILAIPFFSYTLISTFLFAAIIETASNIFKSKFNSQNIIN